MPTCLRASRRLDSLQPSGPLAPAVENATFNDSRQREARPDVPHAEGVHVHIDFARLIHVQIAACT